MGSAMMGHAGGRSLDDRITNDLSTSWMELVSCPFLIRVILEYDLTASGQT